MRADFGRFSNREFSTTFVLRNDGSLLSSTGAPGWSLLETRGPLMPVPPDIPPITERSLLG